MIFDEKIGIAFEGYNAELIRAFLILVHYTDLDTTQFDTGEGRQTLYDILATHDMWPDIMGIVDEDIAEVDNICMRLESSARRNFEHTHSLQYQVLKNYPEHPGHGGCDGNHCQGGILERQTHRYARRTTARADFPCESRRLTAGKEI